MNGISRSELQGLVKAGRWSCGGEGRPLLTPGIVTELRKRGYERIDENNVQKLAKEKYGLQRYERILFTPEQVDEFQVMIDEKEFLWGDLLFSARRLCVPAAQLDLALDQVRKAQIAGTIIEMVVTYGESSNSVSTRKA